MHFLFLRVLGVFLVREFGILEWGCKFPQKIAGKTALA